MITRRVFAISLLFTLGTNIFASQEGKVFRDGHDWKDYNKTIKLYYIIGVCDGSFANLCASSRTNINRIKGNSADRIKEAKKFNSEVEKNVFYVNVGGAAFGTIVEGVDEFYKDYANLDIPIFAIATLAAKRIRGEITDLQVSELLQELRGNDWRGQ